MWLIILLRALDDWTPLHFACNEKNYEIAKYLI